MRKSGLRAALVVAVVLAAAFGYRQLAQNKGYALRRGSEAPGFRLPSLAGGEVDLSSYRGRVVVLNFWATWCPPCVSEMPSLERLHRTLGPQGLAVVSVSADEDEAVLRRFVSANALSLPVLRDPGGRVASGRYRTTGYPETFVLDRRGVLLQHVVGPAEWDEPQALAHFRALLSGSSAAIGGGGAATRDRAVEAR
jgi:cytochrome c biogenesis protein CcmG/thiol:disulfide interchange protein DsbE